jgi:hypothetical protein
MSSKLPTLFLLAITLLTIFCLPYVLGEGGGDLNPDDFHRMDIDVEAEIKRLSKYPEAAQKHSRNAYVLIHYEGTPKDDMYVLGTRVVIRSILETGTQQDVVVVCATNVRESTIEQFKREGAIIKMVPNIPNPYKGEQQFRRSYKARFEFTFNKLYMWNLLEYERVIYNDADNLITRNIDELFLCGHYCVTYFNPLYFHTGMMVIKPDRAKFQELLHGLLSLEMFSYDGADQGFLTYAFPGIEGSPLFHPARALAENKGHPSEEKLMRFPMEYNINAVFYYGSMSWDPYRAANLPFSYFKENISPYTGVSPAVLPPGTKTDIITAIQTQPIDQADYALPICSIDYPLAQNLKPMSYIPFIFFHTSRYWSPIREMVDALDYKHGVKPFTDAYFFNSFVAIVLPFFILPFVFNIIAQVIPGMDNVRIISRKVARVTGTFIPATISVLLTFVFSMQLVANVIPVETKPQLAYLCVFLCVIFAQYNLAHCAAILLSPPCPSHFKNAPDSIDPHNYTDSNTALEEIGVYRSTLYGLTFFHFKQFFSSFGLISFISSPHNSPPISTLNNISRTKGGDFDSDDSDNDVFESSILDPDHVLQECDFGPNISTGIETSRKLESFMTDSQESKGIYKSVQSGGNKNHTQDNDMDLELDDLNEEIDQFGNDMKKNTIKKSSNISQYSTTNPNKFISPTEQNTFLHHSLRRTALETLGDSLSLRGGISPTIMLVHFIIAACMVLNLAKYGTYSSFIHKIAYLAAFLLTFIIYSIIFLNKIMEIALGKQTSLGKLYL